MSIFLTFLLDILFTLNNAIKSHFLIEIVYFENPTHHLILNHRIICFLFLFAFMQLHTETNVVTPKNGAI